MPVGCAGEAAFVTHSDMPALGPCYTTPWAISSSCPNWIGDSSHGGYPPLGFEASVIYFTDLDDRLAQTVSWVSPAGTHRVRLLFQAGILWSRDGINLHFLQI
jgi:hypothetical protein